MVANLAVNRKMPVIWESFLSIKVASLLFGPLLIPGLDWTGPDQNSFYVRFPKLAICLLTFKELMLAC